MTTKDKIAHLAPRASVLKFKFYDDMFGNTSETFALAIYRFEDEYVFINGYPYRLASIMNVSAEMGEQATIRAIKDSETLEHAILFVSDITPAIEIALTKKKEEIADRKVLPF